MKALLLFPLALLLSSCGYFTDQSNPVIISITSVENTEEGTLVTLSIDSNDDLLYTGVDYRIAGEYYQLFFQGLLEGDNPERTILLSDVDDGPTIFRAFAVIGNLYGYSEEVTFEVVSALPEVPCTLQDNFVRINGGASCQVNSERIRISADAREYEIDLRCNDPALKMSFPREPTSGVYRTVNSLTTFATTDKVVKMDFISGSFFQVNDFQEVYVERTSDFTIITFCSLEYRTNPAFTISGRAFVPR